MEFKLIQGDCLVELKKLEDNSIDAVVTDPPYGLSFMGKKWDYDVPSIEIWAECLRVLKPGGYLLAFAGTRTQHRMAVRIEDAGFEIRDMIAWVYGSGFPKSLNIGKSVDKLQGNEREEIGTYAENAIDGSNRTKNPNIRQVNFGASDVWNKQMTKGTSEWEGWGTALKPALEPITVARKPIEGTVAENCLKWGVGGINIDECRIPTDEDQRRPSAGGENGLTGTSTFKIRERKVEEQIQHTGRFPANLIHDGSDEVVELFPYTKGSKATGLTPTKARSWKNTSVAGINRTGFDDEGSASRFFYCAKASKSERNKGCECLEKEVVLNERIDQKLKKCLNCNKYQVATDYCKCEEPNWHVNQTGNNHPTVKPIALMEYLIKLVSREGAIILDPFMGSGTTGIACKNLNREFIGVERDEEYLKIAKARIENTASQLKIG